MGTLSKIIFTGILLGFTSAAAFSQGMMGRQSTTLPWHTTSDEAFAEAAKKNLPILAVFR